MKFSPRVERVSEGVFLLDPTGLEPLYRDLREWVVSIHTHFRERGLVSSVILGFVRHQVLALARAQRGVVVLESPEQERVLAQNISLACLDVEAGFREELECLAIRTLGDVARIAPEQWVSRFGEKGRTLQRMCSGAPSLPFSFEPHEEPWETTVEVEPPDSDSNRLLFGIKAGLDRIIERLRKNAAELVLLVLDFRLENRTVSTERVEPAFATRDVRLLLDLVRLRLERVHLQAPVAQIRIFAGVARGSGEQLALSIVRPRRDPKAAAQALSRIRARWGERSVVLAELCSAHLPEAKFHWIKCDREGERPAGAASLEKGPASRVLVRRVLTKPEPLMLPFFESRAREPIGPFRIQGGWWVRRVERDYYYLETKDSDLLWVYYDRVRKHWFLHGYVD